MSRPVVYRRIAQAEYDDAAEWYESRREGLGIAFIDEIERVADRIAEQPERYPLVRKDVREAPVRRFPYCIYYRIKPDQIVIVSVFHTSRNPAEWQSRT